MEKVLIWGLVLSVGAVLGALLRLSVVLSLLGGVTFLAIAGGLGAIYFKLIQPEWAYLLMIVPPVGGAIFVSAAGANALFWREKSRRRSARPTRTAQLSSAEAKRLAYSAAKKLVAGKPIDVVCPACCERLRAAHAKGPNLIVTACACQKCRVEFSYEEVLANAHHEG